MDRNTPRPHPQREIEMSNTTITTYASLAQDSSQWSPKTDGLDVTGSTYATLVEAGWIETARWTATREGGTTKIDMVDVAETPLDLTRPEPHMVGIQGAALNVTLTATDNEYLARNLPCEGVIILNELNFNGDIAVATFRVRRANGRLMAPVLVGNPKFTYGVK